VFERTVQTVRGPVAASDLGITLPHEHLWLDLYRAPARWDLNGVFNDVDLIVDELALFSAVGGGAVVELTLDGAGRDPNALVEISKRSKLHVIMGSGWYREPYYPARDEIAKRSSSDLADQLIVEIRNGVGNTGIRPGIIGELGCDKSWMSPTEERIHRAAAKAHNETGLAILTHSIGKDIGLWQLDILEEEGVDLSRVAVGHADSYASLDYYRNILERGAFIEFDKVANPTAFYMPQAKLLSMIRTLVDEGYLSRILLSQDTCLRSELTVFGGRGYGYLAGEFTERLSEIGLSQPEIQTLIRENPQRFLASGV
jgi:predicted metal-dependent phosphotriesterase family hydrolase